MPSIRNKSSSSQSSSTPTHPKLPTSRSGFLRMSLLRKAKTLLTPSASSTHVPQLGGFTTAKSETDLFPATRPEVDGEECLRDCDSCTTHYPKKFSIDEDDKLYGHVTGWSTHLVVGTGKTDWVRDVTDEKGSVMQAVGKAGLDRKNGKIMLSASNLPSGEECHGPGVEEGTSDVLLLPAWVYIEKVGPSQVPKLLTEVVERSATNVTPVNGKQKGLQTQRQTQTQIQTQAQDTGEETSTGTSTQNGHDSSQVPDISELRVSDENSTLDPTPLPASISTSFKTKPIPHDYLILMCSHKTRDARCGQSAPLLRKEFERILRPLGMYRDVHDERPGGVGIYFINHVGGHKYSANLMIYRRQGRRMDGTDEEEDGAPLAKEAVQLIWLARVRPEDCENIIRYTVLQGKVAQPQRQLRGGFDREKGLTSW
ncbi:Sucrase/ferredoxin-like-domain-containing protein [Exophiala viscosa]|uniref:Sucrase/ferredoxin-like-domain-containing protein n=1 Tax=Exophiala viscosa TaxID=2486360 RepID=A0AAN6DWA9_9EURO|nr:Sucrase/ferredoxin-like-domain-containing protein [Exophiala viscosa]KAI1625706.1 Sucrase/ferredoxin-like-domain-containing protein [Exophiala viscosa]